MKKILFLITFLTAVLAAPAQTLPEFDSAVATDSGPHMTFKNIPIDGHLDDFTVKLIAEGFKVEMRRESLVQMEGPFAGYDSEIYVVASPETQTVFKITVFQPEISSWHTLKSRYLTLKEQFVKKYGEPKSEFEFFESPYEEGDGYEMTAVKSEKCHYATFWEVPEGFIMVSISEFSQIRIVYEDRLNSALDDRETEAGVMNDI